jgi:hypothetical protein
MQSRESAAELFMGDSLPGQDGMYRPRMLSESDREHEVVDDLADGKGGALPA